MIPRISRISLAASLFLFAACAAPQEHAEGESQALARRVSNVRLRTALQGRFLGAENNGGGALTATATVAQAWESFSLIDVNGGALNSGDEVYVRSGSGHYLRATNGGGTSADIASTIPGDFETFRIVKEGSGGAITNGNIVGLQTITTMHFLSAENGGGGAVHAYGAALGPWERFSVELGPVSDASVRISGVTLRTGIAGRYVGAVNNGGGKVIATATTPLAWETFNLHDTNGGLLEHGDLVFIQAGNGRYFRAMNGGGGALDADGAAQLGWETYRIHRQAGSGVVRSGDTVGFQTIGTTFWLSAANGGGGDVLAYGPAFDTWEHFTITLGPSEWVYGPETGGGGGGGGGGNGLRLVWSDEFNGNALDESKWVYEVQRPRWVNNELQNYTNRRRENARVENGNLVIEARRDWFEGHEYSSARLKTQGRASFRYGRIEASIQLPGGRGTWPAFWMMPDNQSRGWPACGEIDIMEHVGYDVNLIHATTHSLRYNWRSSSQRTGTRRITGATTGFHTYTVDWYEDRIEASVDGVRYFTSPNDRTGDDAWPFDKNFHIILNLAVGGDWGGAQGVDPNVWPQRMLVDYVRVYAR